MSRPLATVMSRATPTSPRASWGARLSMALALGAGVGACTPAETAQPQIALAALPAPGTCAEWRGQPVERSCLPRMAMADTPLVLELEPRCAACGSTADTCSVSVEGRTVSLSLDGKTCEPPPGVACRESCTKSRVRCRVPALPEGRYLVRYGDPGGHVDTLDVVSRRDVPAACTLDDVGG